MTVDQHEIVQLASQHLIALGHRRITWLNGPATYWSAQQRRDAIDLLDDNIARHTVVDDVDPTFDGGWKAAQGMLWPDVTAVVAFNDLMALGVLVAATASGIDVPGAVSIVGSDDTPPSTMSWPPLTSIASPTDRLGQVAVQSLLRSRSGRRQRSTVLSPTLSIRRSTGRPRTWMSTERETE